MVRGARVLLIVLAVAAPDAARADVPMPPAALPAAPPVFRTAVTLSPYHLGYPMFLGSIEHYFSDRLSLMADVGAGSYRGASVLQLGLRHPVYFVGTIRRGIAFGPFARASFFRYADANAVLEPPSGDTGHLVTAPVTNDAEAIRSNGRHGIYYGGFVGGSIIRGARDTTPRWDRGMTIRAGFLIGYVSVFGNAPYGAAPNATRPGGGFLPMLYADLGWSF
jgi:hypothetical protein